MDVNANASGDKDGKHQHGRHYGDERKARKKELNNIIK